MPANLQPPAALLTAVAAAVGPLTPGEPVAQGQESTAFGVVHTGRPCVLRLNRDGTDFAKDALAHRAFASAELPVPAFVASGHLPDGRAWCLTERAPGRTLQDTDRATLLALAPAVARVMDAIAAAPVLGTGHGSFGPDGVAPFPDWRGFVLAVADPAPWAEVAALADPASVRPLLNRLATADTLSEVRQLVHGDFGSNNVLATPAGVTGVVDWSEALWGDPDYDLANLGYWRTWLDCMAIQADHLEARITDPARRRLLAYQLRIGLGELLSDARAADRARLAWTLARCRQIAAALDA